MTKVSKCLRRPGARRLSGRVRPLPAGRAARLARAGSFLRSAALWLTAHFARRSASPWSRRLGRATPPPARLPRAPHGPFRRRSAVRRLAPPLCSRVTSLAAPCGRRQSDALPSPRSLHSRGRRSPVRRARPYGGLPPVGHAMPRYVRPPRAPHGSSRRRSAIRRRLAPPPSPPRRSCRPVAAPRRRTRRP